MTATLGSDLAAHLKPVLHEELRENDYLFRRNDAVRHLYVIELGSCRLERTTRDGHILTLAQLDRGQIVAEGSLFNERYGCDCRVQQPSRIAAYARAAVRELLASDPAVAQAWLVTLAHQVMELRTRLELRNVKSARERIALHLELHADAEGVFPLPGTYKNLAHVLGLTHEALYRTLATMEREGEIRRGDKQIRLIKTPR